MRTHAIVWCALVSFACGQSSSSTPDTNAAPGAGRAPGTAEAGVPGGKDAGPGSGPVRDAGVDHDVAPAHSCCVNGAYYVCPTPTSILQCTGFDLSSCFDACAPSDEACAKACDQKALNARRDPSSCSRDPGRDGLCPDAGVSNGSTSTRTSTHSSSADPGAPAAGSPSTPKNVCGGPFLGMDCGVGGTCIGDQHCTDGKCYPSSAGNPCTFLTDCGSGGHCTRGCCTSGASGSACDTGIDCTSGSCTNGACQ